uniref:Expansin n=1 Tax=Amorphophallus konjac TaxID=78372 RepID=A0A482E6P2_AMOKO|nr:expansin-A13 [Amorphophallus konjac]
MPLPGPRRVQPLLLSCAGALRLLLQLHALLTPLHHLLRPASAHQTTSSYADDALGEWKTARATYYAASDPRDTVAGACGYGDLGRSGYGLGTVGLSESMFEKGQICGACFEVRCVEELRYCIPGTSIKLTVTNFCPPNYGLPADAGGHCNPPNQHLVMPIEAFEKIAIWKAGNMPVQYRRIRCVREGGIRFTMDGYGVFHSVLVSNVGGSGDVTEVKVKGTRSGWLQMARNWGQNWHINADLKGQPLSFQVTTSDGATRTSYSVAPRDWSFGHTYVGKQFGQTHQP